MWFVFYPVISLGSIPKNRITKSKDKHIFRTSDSYCQIPTTKPPIKHAPTTGRKGRARACEPVCKERNAGRLPWRPGGRDTALPLQGAHAQALVRDRTRRLVQPQRREHRGQAAERTNLRGKVSHWKESVSKPAHP